MHENPSRATRSRRANTARASETRKLGPNSIGNKIGAAKDSWDYVKSQHEAEKAKQEADPVFKLSQHEEFGKPGAQATIQSLIDDPKTDPVAVPRLKALLPRVEVAQANVIELEFAHSPTDFRTRESCLFSVPYAQSRRKRPTTQICDFELCDRRRKPHANI